MNEMAKGDKHLEFLDESLAISYRGTARGGRYTGVML